MIKLKKYLSIGFLFALLFTTVQANAQISFDSLQKAMKIQPRYILMNVHSEYCLYCMMQKKRIENDKDLLKKLNNDVYFVQWKLESQPNFVFNNTSFTKSGNNRYAGTAFLNKYAKDPHNPVAFPAWLVFDQDYKVIYHYFGLLPNSSITKMIDIIQKNEQKTALSKE